MDAWHSWDPKEYTDMVFDLYWLLLSGLWLKKSIFAKYFMFHIWHTY
jgi:hypothetical protein